MEMRLYSELLAALIAGTVFYAILMPLTSCASRVPGPWYSRWTGLVLKYKWLTGQRPIYIHELHEKYGPVVRIAPNEIDFTDMDAVKVIYDRNETFKKSSFYRNLTAVRAPVLFTITDVAIHRRLRRLMSTPISATSLKFHHELVKLKVDLYLQRIKDEMTSQGAADIFKWNMFLATDVVVELSFGDSFKTLENGEASFHTSTMSHQFLRVTLTTSSQRNKYVHLIESIGPLGALRSAFPTLTSLAFMLPFPLLQLAANASRDIRQYGEESLNRYYRLASSDTHGAHRTLFAKLRESEQNGEITFDEICANAGGYIMAGSDTTASTLTYLIWSVCRQPQIKEALIQQLQGLPPDFDDDHLRGITYLGYVIEETLRLYTAAPSGLPRETPKDGAILAGYQLDAGTVVCAQSYSMHRDPLVFPNPEQFNPLRWEAPTKAMIDSFMPFGRGPRICIGLHLAQIELRMAAANFFLAFPNAKLSLRDGFSDQDMVPKIFFVSNPVGRRCLVEVQ